MAPTLPQRARKSGAPDLARIRRSLWPGRRSRRRSRCWRRSRRFCRPCGSDRVRLFLSRMGGGRWNWGWRFWRRLAGTPDGSGGGEGRGQIAEFRGYLLRKFFTTGYTECTGERPQGDWFYPYNLTLCNPPPSLCNCYYSGTHSAGAKNATIERAVATP